MYKIFYNQTLVEILWSREAAYSMLRDLIANQKEGEFYFLLEPAPCLLVGREEY